MIPLEVHNLTKIFTTRARWPFGTKNTFKAVDNLSFNIHPGEIVGLLGINGAGKTTTIQMLMGTLTPSKGTIKYFGQDFEKTGPQALTHVTHASGYDKLPANLTVWDNLDIFGRLYLMDTRERHKRIESLLAFFKMESFAKRRTGTLSAGQMTRVILIKAFLPHPRLILLDEPTASLDPEVAHEVRSFILQEREKTGLSVLFTSHNMAEVTDICDRVLMMQNGHIIADDSPLNLASSIQKAHIHLVIQEGLQEAIEYAQKHDFSYTLEKQGIEIESPEDRIAQVLIGLARAGVTYVTVSIDRPTLEDYFLSKTKKV